MVIVSQEEERAVLMEEEAMVEERPVEEEAKATPKEAKREVEEEMVTRLVEAMGAMVEERPVEEEAKATPKEAKPEEAKREVAKPEAAKRAAAMPEAAATERVEEEAGLVMEKEVEGVAARGVMLVEVNQYLGQKEGLEEEAREASYSIPALWDFHPVWGSNIRQDPSTRNAMSIGRVCHQQKEATVV